VRAVKVAFAKHMPLPAADLDPDTVVRTIGALKLKTPTMAARVGAYGRACFGWAIKERLIKANPFADLSLPSTVRRDRVLTDMEVRAIWHATAKPGSFNSIIRMLLLTGAREGEVAGLRWDELSDDGATWTIPAKRAKNGVASIVPLSPQARAIIEAASRYASNDLCFPGERGVFKGWDRAKGRLDDASGVRDWRIHDIRRSVATNLQKLGVRLEVTEAVLNHVGGSRSGVTGIYQRHTWADEKAAALAAWGNRVEAIVEGREPGSNVVAMRA
jgi:integrase